VNSQSLLRYIWCLLVAGILLISCLPARGWLYQFLVPYFETTWTRFFIYSVVTSIPFVVWLDRKHVIYSFMVGLLAAAAEILSAIGLGKGGHQVDILPELFGVAAGILLGLNLRRMRTTLQKSAQITQKQDRSPIA